MFQSRHPNMVGFQPQGIFEINALRRARRLLCFLHGAMATGEEIMSSIRQEDQQMMSRPSKPEEHDSPGLLRTQLWEARTVGSLSFFKVDFMILF